MTEKLKDALILVAEIAGFLVVFVIFLLILNFFNILSLSTIYPKQLGFLPHLNQTNVNSTTQNKTLLPSPAFTPVDTSAITTRDSADKINQYKNYAVPGPRFSTQDASWMAGGVFAGYGKNAIMLISSNNTLVLNLNNKTVFEEIIINNLPGSSAGTMGFNPYPDFNSFIKNAVFGKYVQVYYNQGQATSNKTATKVDYTPSYKF
jgi:hypothetical protein